MGHVCLRLDVIMQSNSTSATTCAALSTCQFEIRMNAISLNCFDFRILAAVPYLCRLVRLFAEGNYL